MSEEDFEEEDLRYSTGFFGHSEEYDERSHPYDVFGGYSEESDEDYVSE